MAVDHNDLMSESSMPDTFLHGASRLDDWGVIRATGDEARKFLHGQLTQSIVDLAPGQARLAGYCSAKGRLLASFVVWAGGDGDVLLACTAELLPTVLKRLSMFVMRARCKLVDATAERPLWGLVGDAALAATGLDVPAAAWGHAQAPGLDLIRLPDGLADGCAVTRALWAGPLDAALPVLDKPAWQWLEVSSGVPRITATTAEQFVPQMVNLERVGGVDFRKGCYPGQEVVARSQYRGTLKRRAFIMASPLPLQPGMEVFHNADPGQPAGMVVLAGTRHGAQHAALVELKLAALEGGTLHAGSALGPLLTPQVLPYPLDAEEAAALP
jgi:folate-binding protein YgfZ